MARIGVIFSLAIRCSSLVSLHGGFKHDGDDDHLKTGGMAMEITLEPWRWSQL
jgi:hypothetical protein